ADFFENSTLEPCGTGAPWTRVSLDFLFYSRWDGPVPCFSSSGFTREWWVVFTVLSGCIQRRLCQ
ncbi:hypothetical protein, partial [Pseudomonas avellanae]|uniref:hypothetical protein n=1 Tax=Pseudomonas avellanae TaxID=46257 RepID=UPI001ED9AB5E